jgi:hypothetical protein
MHYVDYSTVMPIVLQIGIAGVSNPATYIADGYHDIAIVWGGTRVLFDEGASLASDERGLTPTQSMDLAGVDAFDDIDYMPWSGLNMATYNDYVHMWREIRANARDGALVVIDPVLDEPGDHACVLMIDRSHIRVVDEASSAAIVLAVRASRDNVPEHRKTHRAATFGLVCRLRANNAKILSLRARMREAGIAE